MAIFKYEMKQYRNYVIVWSLALSCTIFFLIPVFISLMSNNALVTPDTLKTIQNSPILKATGTDINSMLTPLGSFSYVNSFIMIAAAINGAFIGISMISKEYTQKTNDFLMTKPHSRSSVFINKLLAGICCSLITGSIYLVTSYVVMQINAKGRFDILTILLIAFSIILIQFIYMALGFLIVMFIPNIRVPSIVALCIAFITYVFGTYSRIVTNSHLELLSPFSYFSGGYILQYGSYDTKYLLLFTILTVAFTLASYSIFVRKEIMSVS